VEAVSDIRWNYPNILLYNDNNGGSVDACGRFGAAVSVLELQIILNIDLSA
jgi:hypothetical protein